MTTYQVPKSQASFKQNRFEFQFPGSTKKYSVPLLQFIRPALAMSFETMSDHDACHALFDEYYPDEHLFTKFDDATQLEAFLDAWREASTVSMGESEASSNS